MNNWITLRKGDTHLHLAYGHTFTKNLFGYKTQIRTEPDFEIRIDLSPNLRSRNKQTNTYLDARELADGALTGLTLLQLNDDKILTAIARSMKRIPDMPRTWKLTIVLEKEWFFEVEPELETSQALHSLFLHVCGPYEESN